MARRQPQFGPFGQITYGDWQHVSYAQAWATARRIAQGLMNRGLNADRPVAILSENSLEHALMVLGCMVAGIPFVPTSSAYSLLGGDYEKLRHVLLTVTPGLLFASDSARYGEAIAAVASSDMDVVLVNGTLDGMSSTSFAELIATAVTPAVYAAMAATGPETIVKFLFTSGSTKLPKAVINTHQMLCANQQQVAQSMTVMTDGPLVLVDWLPWSHTFGGNQNFGMVLYHGGSMYIDDGKPTAAAIPETLRNLREIALTVYFNVPMGFEAIAEAMKTDALLRKCLLSRVKMFFYAAAAMPQMVWGSLYDSAARELGERIVIASGLGMTETGPHCLFGTHAQLRAGELGLPGPGMEVKLVEVGDKTEIRYKGPNVTPGYWRAPEETAAHFDEEGFFCSGDAVRWTDETNIHMGLSFDGRLAEDFKLTTGTFVSVGPLRSKIIAAGAPYIQDVVITGHNRREIGAMVFPTPALRTLSHLPADTAMHLVVDCENVLAFFQRLVDELNRSSTGSATRIARLCLLADPPTLARGEFTDKGSINQRAVLSQRAQTVDRLHTDELRYIVKPRA
jgi:feruloyl-CoA synthase